MYATVARPAGVLLSSKGANVGRDAERAKRNQLGALGLVLNALILWNMRYPVSTHDPLMPDLARFEAPCPERWIISATVEVSRYHCAYLSNISGLERQVPL